MSAPTAVISWLRYTANDLGMELDEHDNASILAVLHEIDRRLNLADDRCGCCGWREWWRNPSCVQTQPPEFVIDDAAPGVLRAPRPEDFR